MKSGRLLKQSLFQVLNNPQLWLWGFVSALGSISILNFNPNILHLMIGNTERVDVYQFVNEYDFVILVSLIAFGIGTILAVLAILGRSQLIRLVVPVKVGMSRYWLPLWIFNLILSIPFVLLIVICILGFIPYIFGGPPDLTEYGIYAIPEPSSPEIWFLVLGLYTLISLNIQAWGERILVLERVSPGQATQKALRFAQQNWRHSIKLNLICFLAGVISQIFVLLICGAFFQPLMAYVFNQITSQIWPARTLIQGAGAFVLTMFAAAVLSTPFTIFSSVLWTNTYCELKQIDIQSVK